MLAEEEAPATPADGAGGQQSLTGGGGEQQPVAGGGSGQQGRPTAFNKEGAIPQNQVTPVATGSGSRAASALLKAAVITQEDPTRRLLVK